MKKRGPQLPLCVVCRRETHAYVRPIFDTLGRPVGYVVACSTACVLADLRLPGQGNGFISAWSAFGAHDRRAQP